MNKFLLYFVFFLFCFIEVFSQDWSYRIGPDTLKNKSYYAYLWIPSSANSGIRGLIMAPQISSEWQFVRSPEIRKVAEKQKLAIVYFYPSRISIMNAQDTLYLQNTLNQFADISGFQEISHAPWFLFGHSTGCLFAMHLAYWKPERTFGVICYKGGIVPNPKWFPGDINNVPVMGVQGEFEEYDNTQEVNATDHSSVAVRRDVLNYRKASPEKNLLSATILPGEGHMVWTKNGIGIIAEFIEKAARYLIPKNAIATEKPVELNTLNIQDGWAAKGDPHTNINEVKIGAMKDFKNQDSCYWFFNKQFAKHWLALQKDTRKERQHVCSPSEPPVLSPSPFKPMEFIPNGKIYETHILMDSRIHISGSSSSGLPVEVIYQTGPGFIENGILRVNPANIMDERVIRVGLRQNGSEKYRIADRLIKVRLDKCEGKEQKLAFGTIPKALTPGDKVEIKVNSTSGLPVTLCVNAGPAVLNGNVLCVKPFTSRSGKAWIILRAGQEGNKEFATADPVEVAIEVENKNR